jgi:hypothetical protein
MDERFTYFLLTIPAACVFWFLYAIIVTELPNWLAYRRLRNNKPTASVESPQKRPKAKTMRGFDYPELFFDDSFQRIGSYKKELPPAIRK